MKVLTTVGTRPEIIRLSRVMAALDKYVEHVIVHTGQNYDYELNQVFFDDLELRKPDHFLETAAQGQSTCETIGQIMGRMEKLLAEESPDALLVLGDTNSCLAAYPAKRRKIPVFHMEAGNRCFDQRVPEEINRKIVDHISDINMPYSTISREYLLNEGLPPDRIIKTGSPMYEVLHYYMPKIEQSDVLERLGLVNSEASSVNSEASSVNSEASSGNSEESPSDKPRSTTQPTPGTIHDSPFTTHASPCTIHDSPCTIHDVPFTTHDSPAPKPYYLISAHREENIADPDQFRKLVDTLQQLGKIGIRIIVTTHPRSRWPGRSV